MSEFIEANLAAVIVAVAAAVFIILFIMERSRRQRERRERRYLVQRQRDSMLALERSVNTLSQQSQEQQDRLRRDNDAKLEEMRLLVSQRLGEALETRISGSFNTINAELKRVNEGLGEMHTLAKGVGDLRKLLTNVKQRGIWGEAQLKQLLSQVLSSGQYEENVAIVNGSQERVEFAVRLPAANGVSALLPIDSKFPVEDYLRLVNEDDPVKRTELSKLFNTTILAQAKQISQKYISPPDSTDFAIMFLPLESLYVEVASRPELTQAMQAKYGVIPAGPNTLYALLTSLAVGFRAVALEQKSGEIIAMLTGVSQEFEKYEEAVSRTRQRVEGAERELTALETRARAVNRKLRDIGEL